MGSRKLFHECLDIHEVRMNNLSNYFKCESEDCRLPSSSGFLSKKVSLSMIQAVNAYFSERNGIERWLSDGTKRGPYEQTPSPVSLLASLILCKHCSVLTSV